MELFFVAEIIGISACALSGFLVATEERLDLLGIVIAAFLTALGGGIIRDLLADVRPYALTHYLPTLLVLATVVGAVILRLQKKPQITQQSLFVLSDSVGLASFAVSGALVGVQSGFNIIGVALMALTVAVGGGVMRDMLLNRVPLFLSSEFYGTVAIAGGVGVYVVQYYAWGNGAIAVVFGLTLLLRLFAYHQKWRLPTLQ